MGTSYINSVCRPFLFAWPVDRSCHRITHQAFDSLREQVKGVCGFRQGIARLALRRSLAAPVYSAAAVTTA
eukprot:3650800-Alexandrium_andersonii.AAC.1